MKKIFIIFFSALFVLDFLSFAVAAIDSEATRPPVLKLKDQERFVMVGEPVTIKLKEISDPDGKCNIFQYEWKKSKSLEVSEWKIDNRFGSIFFIPQNAGVFTLNVRATELCEELGTLSSEPVFMLLIIRNKQDDFSDIAESPEYQNAIYTLYHRGSMKGYGGKLMKPTAYATRAEFLKMVFETLKYPIPKTIFSPRYIDVSTDAWFSPYIFQADQLGVIKGYPDGQFHPQQPINLSEALKIVLHFTTISIMDSDQYSFPDVKNDDWFSRYVQTAFREGILDVQPKKNVFPGAFVSRGKAAQIIVRTFLFPVNRINQVNTIVQERPDEFEDFSRFTK